MSVEPGRPAETPPSPQDLLSQELNTSLSSVWARYTGSRPSDASVAIDGSFVRWTLPGGTAELETGMTTINEAREPGQPTRTRHGYERETSAVVSKATRRLVRARISKLDKSTGAAIESFVLEAPSRKY